MADDRVDNPFPSRDRAADDELVLVATVDVEVNQRELSGLKL